jgi:signal transduction histidine kinase
VSRLGFRTRLLLALTAFAVLPAATIAVVALLVTNQALPMVAAGGAWARVASTGNAALAAARQSPGAGPDVRAALDTHEAELRASLDQAKRLEYLAPRVIRPLLLGAVAMVLVVTLVAGRVAGHFSRQLSRPLDEVVEWTERIARGDALPAGAPTRGAPEFEVLRTRMRTMAAQLTAGRHAATEAARLNAFRETARRVAHELKNPLTPIRFAVTRLRQTAVPAQTDAIEVLETETTRLDTLARSFAQFGRLPDAPAADVDVAELLRYATRATLPATATVSLNVPESLPFVHGQHDALARAISNVLLNAIDAAGSNGIIGVTATALTTPDAAVAIAIHDNGPGIEPEVLDQIWEPYVTSKPGGTGLGLAIVRQTVLAHGGTLHARSTPGAGTTITMTIPCAPSLPASASTHE